MFQYEVKCDLPVPYAVVTIDDEHMLLAVNPAAHTLPDWLQELIVNDLVRSSVAALTSAAALVLALCTPEQQATVLSLQAARARKAARLAATGTDGGS
jgi:hypothetical protein